MKEYREPWEIIAMIASGYLGVLSIHCVLTVMEYGLLIANNREQFNLGDCFQIPSLV